VRRKAEALHDALEALETDHRRRQRSVVDYALQDFCSNDYLGLAHHPRLMEAATRAISRYGAGGRASHLINGHTEEHEQLEYALARLTGRERALVFSTGYMANLGVIQALSGHHAVVIQDRLNHASLIDAGRLAAPRGLSRYAHADVANAKARLEKAITQQPQASRLLVTDGVFSMDGDLAPLPELAQLAKEYEAWLVVDDAHGIGTLGQHGGGCCELFNLDSDQVPVLVGTFGKALGSFGAFVAGDSALIEWLLQTSRTYIYTTALPPHVAAATRAALELLADEPWHKEKLQTNIQYFRSRAQQLGIELLDSQSAIQPILLGSEQRTLYLSARLREHRFSVAAIRPPTVPKGTSRLRITLSSRHNPADIDALLRVLADELHRDSV
jgi:8-amino-7-oxononanoate synthase